MADAIFYEYAITPDVFDASYISSDPRLEVILIELLKGISQNGMIANLNKDNWLKHIENNQLPSIAPSVLRDKIIRYLVLLRDRHRIVRHPRAAGGDPSTRIAWLTLAMESHRNVKFDGIIAGRDVLEESGVHCNEFIDALQCLDSPQWESRRRTLTLPTSEPYYRPVLNPLLRHARSLTIVDPYFSPHEDRFVEFLRICIEQMGLRGGLPVLQGRIQIHSGNPGNDRHNPESFTARLDSWEATIKRLYPTTIPHRIKVFLRDQNYGGKRFHDRYILSDQCCIDIPLGTDTCRTTSSDNTTWCLLDHKDMLLKAQEIDPAMNIYALLDDRQMI